MLELFDGSFFFQEDEKPLPKWETKEKRNKNELQRTWDTFASIDSKYEAWLTCAPMFITIPDTQVTASTLVCVAWMNFLEETRFVCVVATTSRHLVFTPTSWKKQGAGIVTFY